MKIKVAVGVALTIFAVVISSLFISSLATKQQSNNHSDDHDHEHDHDHSHQNNESSQGSYTLGDVTRHNKVSDCWIIISGKVYNVTEFINSHPGGSDRIADQCGKDATTAFQTQGGEGSHSDSAREHLESLKIGSLINGS